MYIYIYIHNKGLLCFIIIRDAEKAFPESKWCGEGNYALSHMNRGVLSSHIQLWQPAQLWSEKH